MAQQQIPDDNASGPTIHAERMADAGGMQDVRESQRFSQATIDALSAHILVLDGSGTILMVNRALAEFSGRDPTGENYLAASDTAGGPMAEDAMAFAEGIRSVMRSEVAQYKLEYVNRMDQREHWFLGKVTRFGSDAEVRVVVAHEEITERKVFEAQIEYLATHDALTGLANRTLLSDRLTQAMRHARRRKTRLSLLFLDLDRFKDVNDSYGHTVGDALLQAVAARLSGIIRSADSLARLGGDVFVILLVDIGDPQNVAGVARKIIDAFANPFEIGEHVMYISASIGATVFPEDSEDDINLLFRNADTAMYRAKEASGNTFQFYSRDMSTRAIERSSLDSALRQAILREEFELYYQPKVSLHTGRIVGAEALLRWNHPDMGMVEPGRFIPLAEETGLIVPIGAWVLQRACLQNREWQEQGLPAMCISVNVSARQFQHSDLVAAVANVLNETGLAPCDLELELTESMMMENAAQAIDKLKVLKGMGVGLSIDDFGTGYSSLSYLKRFPIDTLKIDRAFIRDIATDPDDAAITRAVIALAHNLNLTVIAEGVETEEQLLFLSEHGCDEMQGYFFSRPVPAAEFTKMRNDGRGLPPLPAFKP
jgi:diguanylate cyclase (GGDEF)-like protein